jgi:hypothetical protein
MFRVELGRGSQRPPALRLKKDVRYAAAPRAFQLYDIAVQDGKYADHREHGLLYAFRREA